MSSPKRNRARVLTASGLKKLREQIRSHEVEENAGLKYTLERLGELTGLDPETVKNVLDCKGSDKRTIARCFESFGLTLEDSEHIPAAQASAAPSDPGFVGRDEAIADLNALVSRNTKVIVIQARGGVGKTTLARKYLQQEFGSFLEFPIAKETKDIASIEGLIEEKLRQLGEEPGREFLVSLDRLKRKLQAERIGILIDNLEPALDAAGKFIEPHRRYVELLRVLSDPTVKSITLITSRERLREVDVTVQHYGLRSLDVKAWEQFFQGRGIDAETPALVTLHNAYGGNAKAMDIVSGAVLEDFSGDVEAYWQANQDDLFIERDLEDLVKKQFERLQQLDPDAYNLLCRMGCYRYQEVPIVPIEGLFCLLWDVLENRHRRVIKSLQDRSLVDYQHEEFWLHPIVRAEAISRLRLSKDWEVGNQKAAEFWTSSVATVEVIKDALRALEAYYHYIAISDFENACNVITNERANRWDEEEHLGRSFYRLGLLKQLISAIDKIIEKVNNTFSIAMLHNIMGDLNWRAGKIKQAIMHHERAKTLSDELEFKWLSLASLLNLGICRMELLEVEKAIDLFNYVSEATRNTQLHRASVVCRIYLAFLHSLSTSSTEQKEAYRILIESWQEFPVTNLTAQQKGYGYIYMGLTYKNLGQISKSDEMYRKAIIFAQESHYTQVKGKALAGLSELYRVKGELEIAIENNLEAIELLDDIGATKDLAEAYFQIGLTYRKLGNLEYCDHNSRRAIQLFEAMEAPRQVERVREAMQNSE